MYKLSVKGVSDTIYEEVDVSQEAIASEGRHIYCTRDHGSGLIAGVKCGLERPKRPGADPEFC